MIPAQNLVNRDTGRESGAPCSVARAAAPWRQAAAPLLRAMTVASAAVAAGARFVQFAQHGPRDGAAAATGRCATGASGSWLTCMLYSVVEGSIRLHACPARVFSGGTMP